MHRVKAVPYRRPNHSIVLVSLVTWLSGCGANTAERLPPVAEPESIVTLPAADEPDVPSRRDPDGWLRWELGAHWPAPPEVDDRGPLLESETSEGLAGLRNANLERGVPDPRGGLLADVEVDLRTLGGDATIRTVRAMVVPGDVRGVRFAIVGTLLAPVVGLGPSHDLGAECEVALDMLAEDAEPGAAYAHCPLPEVWPALLGTRDDLVEDWSSRSEALAAETFAAADRVEALVRRGVASFGGGDDAQAVRDLEAAFALAARGTDIGVDEVVFRALPSGPQVEEAVAQAVLDEARSRLAREELPEGSPEALVRALGDLSVDVDSADELGSAPEVVAVVSRGEEMIPLLLEAIEDGATLTRAIRIEVGVGRPRVVRVMLRADAAYAALATLLDHHILVRAAFSDFLSMNSSAVRLAAAEGFRRYWASFGALPPAERRWRVLADDEATPLEWAQAATWITRSAPRPRGFRSTFSIGLGEVYEDAPPPLQGESLRERAEPSVGDLIARRLGSVDPTELGNGPIACRLAAAGGRWDAEGIGAQAESVLTTLITTPGPACQPYIVRAYGATRPEMRLTWLRANSASALGAHDPAVLTQVAAWAEADRRFAVEVRRIYRRLSPDGVLAQTSYAPAAVLLARSGLRDAADWLARGLRDGEHMGQVEPRGVRRAWVEASAMSFDVELDAPLSEPMPLRVCDMLAHHVQRALGVPFSLTWDRARRDEAIAAMIALVTAAP